jgi:hypothetical protein
MMILFACSENSSVAKPHIPQPGGYDSAVSLYHFRNLWALVSFHLVLGEKSQNRERDFWVNIEKVLSNLVQLGCFHQVGYIERKDFKNKTPFEDLLRKFEKVSVETACQPLMVRLIVGLDIEPEGIDACFPQCIEVLRSESVTIGLNQYPEIRLSLNETGAFNIEFWTAGKVSPSESNNITSGSPSLGT